MFFFFQWGFRHFIILRRGFKKCAAGAKQVKGEEGREGQKCARRKGRGSPFPIPSLPNPLSLFLPFPPLSKSAVQVWRGCLVWEHQLLMPGQFSSNRQRYGNRPGKPSSTGTSCDPGRNRARGGSWRLNRMGWRSIQQTSHSHYNCAVFIKNNGFTRNQLDKLLYFKVMPSIIIITIESFSVIN